MVCVRPILMMSAKPRALSARAFCRTHNTDGEKQTDAGGTSAHDTDAKSPTDAAIQVLTVRQGTACASLQMQCAGATHAVSLDQQGRWRASATKHTPWYSLPSSHTKFNTSHSRESKSPTSDHDLTVQSHCNASSTSAAVAAILQLHSRTAMDRCLIARPAAASPQAWHSYCCRGSGSGTDSVIVGVQGAARTLLL